MGRLIKSFFFKLSKDIAFRITLIIGVGLALLVAGLYFLIDVASGATAGESPKMLTGPNMLLSSLNPVDNFGLAIPINLITFICLEFSQGTIRNKIIAGHSKLKIYSSLFLSGLILTFMLLTTYIGLCTLLGFISGGFNLDDAPFNMASIMSLMSNGYYSVTYVVQMLVSTIVVYINIVAFTIFFAALFRNIGPCIPIVIITLMMLSFGSYADFLALFGEDTNSDILVSVIRFLDPLYVISGGGVEAQPVLAEDKSYLIIANDAFIATIVNNLVYAGLLYMGGTFIFMKRDVK